MVNKYKLTFGRKFLALLLGSTLLWTGYFVTLFSEIGAQVLNSVVFGGLIGAQVLLCIMYVGGNVWNNYIKAKNPIKDLLPGTGG